MTTKLLWLDIETTGLNPKKDTILEVAVGLTDFDDPFGPWKWSDSWVLRFVRSPKDMDEFPSVVHEMHTRSGLWEACGLAKYYPWDIDRALFDLVAEEGGNIFLAGSTVHFDRAFCKKHLPFFERQLHHRHFDVSSIKLFCEAMGMPKIPKGEAHRAMADIEESKEHARLCMEWLRRSR